MDKLIESIKHHEGYSDTVYKDSLGHLTGGWGHAFMLGSKIPVEASEAYLRQDIANALADFRSLSRSRRYICYLSPNRRRVIVEMIYNLGLSGVRTFRKMLNAIRLEDFETAADEMLDSLWAKQVGKRADELAEIMRQG